MTRVRNDLFDNRRGYDRGRSLPVFCAWQIIKWFFFRTAFPWPSSWKCAILKIFGARLGRGVYLKPQVNIHLPWKLTVGDYAWIGEEAFILNFEPVTIGAHSCISQRAFLCSGNHDFRENSMPYRNRPILVGDGAWIGAQVFVGPGVAIGTESVICAGSVILKDTQNAAIYMGNPAVRVGERWKDQNPG